MFEFRILGFLDVLEFTLSFVLIVGVFCFQISVLGLPVFSSFRMSESADLHRFSDFTNVYFRICWRSRERGRMCSMAKLVALIEW